MTAGLRFCHAFRRGGEHERNAGPAPDLAFDPGRAAVQCRDRPDDGEPQAEAARILRAASAWGSQSSGRSRQDRKSTRLNSSHDQISYAVLCLKKKKVISIQDVPIVYS